MDSRDQGPIAELYKAFPRRLEARAMKVVSGLPSTHSQPHSGFKVKVSGDEVTIPSRIYNPVRARLGLFRTTNTLISDCLYSRHHDGIVRQRSLVSLLRTDEEWVVPFVLQLLGEYVIQILSVLRSAQEVLGHPQYSEFTSQNPEFVARTKSRIVSYWDCYYRDEFPTISQYPGYLVAERLGWWKPNDVRRLRAR